MADADEQWLTLEDVAGRLRIHIETARRFVREGRLPASKFGKRYWIPENAIDEALRKNLTVGSARVVSKAAGSRKKTEVATKRTKVKRATV